MDPKQAIWIRDPLAVFADGGEGGDEDGELRGSGGGLLSVCRGDDQEENCGDGDLHEWSPDGRR